MKDRWKIFWTCVALACVVGIIVGTLTASFKKVELREYGILYYTIFSRVDNSTARGNGNYLVGLDFDFHKFPNGIISLEFKTMTLTKDMSMIQIEGQFNGRLIIDQITPMYEGYGYQYIEFLRASAEQFTRQAIQTYSLSELISNRNAVENNVRGYVCLQLQTQYSWIQCDHVSLGRVGANIPQPQVIEVEKSYQQKQIELLEREIQAQKKLNFYTSGGLQISKNIENLNSNLFLDVSKLVSNAVSQIPVGTFNNRNRTVQMEAAANYYLLSANFPALSNEIRLKM